MTLRDTGNEAGPCDGREGGAAASPTLDQAHEHLRRGRDAIAAGRHLRAERELRAAIAAFEAIEPQGDWYFTAVNELGLALMDMGRLREAADCYRRAHEYFISHHGLDHRDTAITLHNLGTALSELGYVKKGHELLARALDLQLTRGHSAPIDLVHTYETLSNNCKERGDLAYAIELRDKGLALRARLDPPDHVGAGNDCAHLCEWARALGDHTAAERYARQMIAHREAGLGRFHADTADSCNFLGLALASLGRHAEAEAAFRDALGRLEESAGRGDPLAINARINLAKALLRQERPEAAETAARQALRDAEQSLDADHEMTLRALEMLGDIFRLGGRAAQAVPLLTRARHYRRLQAPANEARYAQAVNSLGLALMDCGTHEEAERLLDEAHAMYSRILGNWHDDTCTTQTNRAICLLKMGRQTEAEQLLRDIVATEGRRGGASAASLVHGLFELGAAILARDDLDGARQAYERALQGCVDLYGAESWQAGRCHEALCQVLWRGGQLDAAANAGARAHEIRVARHGVDHPFSITTLKNVIAILETCDLDRAVATARHWYGEARRLVPARAATVAEFECMLGRVLNKAGQREEGVARLRRGLHARLSDWHDAPLPALAAAQDYMDACMSAGRLDELLEELRPLLLRCEESDAVAESWPAALRTFIARALYLLGRSTEAATDARLAWEGYQRRDGAPNWAPSAWALHWLTSSPAERPPSPPWWLADRRPAAGGLHALQLTFTQDDIPNLESLLFEFMLLANRSSRMNAVQLPDGPWLCELDGEPPSPARVWTYPEALLQTPPDARLREPPFDPSRPIAAIELCGSRLAVCFEPGAPDTVLHLQTEIVHGLLRFERVQLTGWNYLPAVGNAEGVPPGGVDAGEFFEALAARGHGS